jgi:transcriptional regulator
MYSLPYFKEKNHSEVLGFIKANPFAMLIGSSNNMPVATQVPFLIGEKEGKLLLRGHIMKNTDHHKALSENNNALCVFTGPHAYVSASWYSNQQIASTWNYISVHAKGKLKFLDENQLIGILKETTAHFENNPHSPSLFEHLPADYVEKLVKAIIAFEIEIDAIENVFKLSQNRDKESYENIINQLEEQDANAIQVAAEMKKRHGHFK